MSDMAFIESFRQQVLDGLKLWDSPSVSIGIIKDGEVVLCEGFGSRDPEKGATADGDTLYQIGSCSKAFTAALIGVLVDKGLLEWDTPIRKYLPGFRFKDAFTTENCTLRDLLAHRTGLPRHEYSWYQTQYTREELVNHMQYLEPNVEMRTRFQYNNYGYILAGYIAEQMTGKTWEALLDEHLFGPLGMTRANAFLDTMNEDPDHAEPYDRELESDGVSTQRKIKFYSTTVEDRSKGIGAPFGPAGSINACPRDMLKWVDMHLNKGMSGDTRVLSEESIAEIHKPNMILKAPLDLPMEETDFCCYGLGWMVEMFRGHKLLQHGGNVDGFSGFTSFMPDLNLGVVAYTNMNGSFLHYALAREVYDHYLGVESGNWVQRYYDFSKERYAELDQVIEHFTGKKIEGTVPSHELAAYAGTYHKDGYVDIIIEAKDDALYMTFNGYTNKLSHFHYDQYVTSAIVGELPAGMPVRFRTADLDGTIDALTIPLVTESGSELPLFIKKAEETKEF